MHGGLVVRVVEAAEGVVGEVEVVAELRGDVDAAVDLEEEVKELATNS